MLKRSSQIRYDVERIVDMCITVFSLTMAVALRRQINEWYPGFLPIFDFWPEAGWLYVLVIIGWGILFDVFGFYDHAPLQRPSRRLSEIVKVNLVGLVLTFFVFYMLRIKYIPRLLFILYAVIDAILMGAKELFRRHLDVKWAITPNILFVGWPSEFETLLRKFDSMPGWRPKIQGFLTPADSQDCEEGLSVDGEQVAPCLGSIDSLLPVLHKHSVDCVILNPSHERFDEVQEIINICETEGVETWLMANFFRTSIARATVDEFDNLPMLTFTSTPGVSWALLTKRVLDFVGGLLLCLVALPVMLIVTILIKATSTGPVLFVQERCTLHGRIFRMYKFRTMVADAESAREALDSDNEMQGPVFKMKDDPRITPVGRFLRKYSLDELPQLFNVLKGDMSLVGPRPPIPKEVAKYENWQRRRLSMRSGITGLWQVSGRNRLGFDEWMRLDLKYIDEWSLMLDMEILAKTLFEVLKGSGC